MLICEMREPGIHMSTREEQNVKRRVYDALNVLIASDVLHKDNKQVYLKKYFEKMKAKSNQPQNPSQSALELMKMRSQLEQSCKKMEGQVEQKKRQLKTHLLQLFSVKRLIERNKKVDAKERFVTFPFLIVLPHPGQRNCLKIEISGRKNKVQIQSTFPSQMNFDLKALEFLQICPVSSELFPEMLKATFGLESKYLTACLPQTSNRLNFE
jgi:hypothetical protein